MKHFYEMINNLINYIRRNTIEFVAVILAIFGLAVFTYFGFLMDKAFDLYKSQDQEILMGTTGQVGDFVGGVVGSLWAFSATLLFWSSLRLQRKEFKKTQNEMAKARHEMIYGRINGFLMTEKIKLESRSEKLLSGINLKHKSRFQSIKSVFQAKKVSIGLEEMYEYGHLVNDTANLVNLNINISDLPNDEKRQIVSNLIVQLSLHEHFDALHNAVKSVVENTEGLAYPLDFKVGAPNAEAGRVKALCSFMIFPLRSLDSFFEKAQIPMRNWREHFVEDTFL